MAGTLTSDAATSGRAAQAATGTRSVSAAERIDVWTSLADRIARLRREERLAREAMGTTASKLCGPDPCDAESRDWAMGAGAGASARLAEAAADIRTLLDGVLTMDLPTLVAHPHPVVQRLATRELMRRFRLVHQHPGAASRRAPSHPGSAAP